MDVPSATTDLSVLRTPRSANPDVGQNRSPRRGAKAGREHLEATASRGSNATARRGLRAESASRGSSGMGSLRPVRPAASGSRGRNVTAPRRLVLPASAPIVSDLVRRVPVGSGSPGRTAMESRPPAHRAVASGSRGRTGMGNLRPVRPAASASRGNNAMVRLPPDREGSALADRVHPVGNASHGRNETGARDPRGTVPASASHMTALVDRPTIAARARNA